MVKINRIEFAFTYSIQRVVVPFVDQTGPLEDKDMCSFR